MSQTAPSLHEPDLDTTGVPEAVLSYARRKVKGDEVIKTWLMHMQGGLSARECGRRIGVSPDSATKWMRECKRAVEAARGDKAQRRVSTGIAVLGVRDVERKRAALLAECEQLGKLELQAKLLDSEQRRLGMDVQRIEQVTLQVQVQSMPPARRRQEIEERMRRMALRGTVNLAALVAGAGGATEGVGGPPRPAASPPLLDTLDVSPPKKLHEVTNVEVDHGTKNEGATLPGTVRRSVGTSDDREGEEVEARGLREGDHEQGDD